MIAREQAQPPVNAVSTTLSLAAYSEDLRLTRTTFVDATTEARFLHHYHDQTWQLARAALIIGTLLYAAFGVFDRWLAPESYATVWVARYTVVGFLVLANFFCFQRRVSPRWRELLVILSVSLGGLGISAMA